MSWRSQLYYWHFRKPKHYQVSYKVQIPQTDSKTLLALPYPKTTDYQVVSQLNFQSEGKAEQREHYIVFQGGNEAIISFDITVQPRQLTLPARFTITDYQSLGEWGYYCQPDQYIHSSHPTVQTIVKKVTAEEKNLVVTIRRLYDYTIQHLHYGNPIPGLYTTTQALSESLVDCGGFATYLAALLRAAQIPCRLIAGFWAGQTHNEMHAWLEYLLPDGRWVVLDPSIDHLAQRGRTQKVAGYNYVGSDRITISTGSDHILHIRGQNLHIGLLQTPICVQTDGTFTYLPTYEFLTI